jgi:hypothetical protein
MRQLQKLAGLIASLGLPSSLGACQTGETELGRSNDGITTCTPNGDPVNLATDLHNCGACGVQCPTGKTCRQGKCVTDSAACQSGFSDCNASAADGCEVNVAADPSNCGACGSVCGAGLVCTAGSCVSASIVCPSGYADCNANSTDGCEVNVATDPSNCGACGNVCGAGLVCAAGSCVSASIVCPSGYADCDANSTDGCEVNVATDPSNCGACGNVCGAGLVCAAGSCVSASIVCPSGYADCDRALANGCEINLNTDTANCGECGRACNPGGTCSQGACSPQAYPCTAGFGECDGNVANGCETNLSSSINDCGACGKICSFTNAVPTCSSSVCAIASCDAGFADCDTISSNGCETDVATSKSNCGSCANVCPTGKQCTAGKCI